MEQTNQNIWYENSDITLFVTLLHCCNRRSNILCVGLSYLNQIQRQLVDVPDQSTLPFIEQNGLIVIEAESIPVVAPWVVENSRFGYTGAGYLRFDGNTIFSGPADGLMEYQIYISNPAKYRVSFRSLKVRSLQQRSC